MINKNESNLELIEKVSNFIYLHKEKLLVLGVLFLLVLPSLGLSQYILRIIIMIFIYTMLGLGLNLLTGYTGQVSLGHAAFFCIGAYSYTLLTTKLGVNTIIALIMGVIITSILGFLFAIPVSRVSGTYLAITTLGLGEVVNMIVLNWDGLTNGALGIRGIPKMEIFGIELTLSNNGIYYFTFIILILVTLMCIGIIKSKTGRAFRTIKEDELVASLMGIKIVKYKILAFVLSAFIFGIAGGIYASMIGYIDAKTFTFDTSIMILSIIILGGLGTIDGVFIGAMLIVTFPELLRGFAQYRFVIYGFILLIMMRYRPQGLFGGQRKWPYKFQKDKKYTNIKKGEDSICHS